MPLRRCSTSAAGLVATSPHSRRPGTTGWAWISPRSRYDSRGAEAILRSVFADVPRAGEWATALLLDGNIGIGGAPDALLARACALIVPGGTVLVETGPPSAPTRRLRVRLESHAAISPWFGWATVGARGIESLARAAGLEPRATIEAEGRWFAELERPR